MKKPAYIQPKIEVIVVADCVMKTQWSMDTGEYREDDDPPEDPDEQPPGSGYTGDNWGKHFDWDDGDEDSDTLSRPWKWQ